MNALPELRISAHAIERYRRRVENCSDAEAICRLTAPSILTAHRLGASSVILPSGHKVIIAGNCVVTVKPKSMHKRRVKC
jgi:hypothetical protein